jgi:hypothetical protein
MLPSATAGAFHRQISLVLSHARRIPAVCRCALHSSPENVLGKEISRRSLSASISPRLSGGAIANHICGICRASGEAHFLDS